jgi:hypothetical protein
MLRDHAVVGVWCVVGAVWCVSVILGPCVPLCLAGCSRNPLIHHPLTRTLFFFFFFFFLAVFFFLYDLLE